MSRPITDGPRPKHAQLSDALAETVRRELGPDDAIPSERELMAAYDVSRATVRKAVDTLVVSGLLSRAQGKGTFVARPRVESQLHLASFTQDMRRRGHEPSTRLVRVDLEAPPAEVAESLGLAAGADAWRLDRVRLADGAPMALEHGWYPADLVPDLDARDLTGSLYELFAGAYGLTIDHASQTLWGESADAAVARRLDAPVHTPLLVFLRVSRVGDRVVEHVLSRYRGDRYQLHMDLVGVPST
jgi:GntR family transcriptional regulator